MQRSKLRIDTRKWLMSKLAAGGYIADTELSAELSPGITIYSPPMPLSTGKALRIARAAGCKVDGGEKYLCLLGGVLNDPADPQSVRFCLSTGRRGRFGSTCAASASCARTT